MVNQKLVDQFKRICERFPIEFGILDMADVTENQIADVIDHLKDEEKIKEDCSELVQCLREYPAKIVSREETELDFWQKLLEQYAPADNVKDEAWSEWMCINGVTSLWLNEMPDGDTGWGVLVQESVWHALDYYTDKFMN